jgi:uncharacterized alpha/beta hydrolase family protein
MVLDKRLILAIVIILAVLIVIYIYLGSTAVPPENVTQQINQSHSNVVNSNVSGIYV